MSDYEIFISYSRRDNKSPDDAPEQPGWVTALCEHILMDHRRFSTEPLRIFFDKHAINDMDDWRHRILGGLRASKILLVCLSPNYFRSEYCRWEWEEYLRRQVHQLMGHESITPVYFVEAPGRDEQQNAAEFDKWVKSIQPWKEDVLRSNFTDIRPWFPAGARAMQEAEVQRRFAKLGESLWERLQRARRASAVPGNLRWQNPHFVGRREELRKLHENLATGSVGVVTAVNGLGGQGKTELAVSYAHAWADRYLGGLWSLGAEGHRELLPLIGNLAWERSLGFTPTEAERNNAALLGRGVLEHLKARALAVKKSDPDRGAAVLLLLDNVSEPGLLSPAQLATLPGGMGADWLRIVATTRLELHEQKHRLAILSVDSLDEESALSLIRDHQPPRTINTNALAIGVTPMPDFASPAEEASAREIVRVLGGFTLAVEQVAIFLGLHEEVTPTSFLATLRERGLPVADVLPVRDEDVAAAMLTQSKQLGVILEETLGRLDAPSRTALQFATLLPPDHVPWQWLRELTVSLHPELGNRDDLGTDPWLAVRRRLQGLRLMTDGDHPHFIRIHRLVAAHLLAGMPDQRRCEFAEKLLPLYWHELYGTEHKCPFDRSDVRCMRLWSSLEPNIARLIESFPNEFKSHELAWISNDFGVFLNVTHQYQAARSVLKRSIRWAEIAELGAAKLASRYSNLAAAESGCGNSIGNLSSIRTAVELDRKSGNAANLAKSLANLSEYYRENHDINAAWDAAIESREAFQRSPFANSWESGVLESNIAQLEIIQGRITDAWKTACHALTFFESGNQNRIDHSRSLRIAARIGMKLDHLSRAAGFCAKALANDLPRILVSAEEFARSCMLMGDIAEHIGVNEEHVVLMSNAFQSVIADLHVPIDSDDKTSDALKGISTAANSLTVVLSTLCSEFDDQLEIEDAEQIARLAVEIDRQFFGPRSRKYASDLCNLAGILLRAGKPKDAKPLLEDAIHIDDQFVNDAEYTPERGKTHSLMAGVCFALGDKSLGQRHRKLAAKLCPDEFSSKVKTSEDSWVDRRIVLGQDIAEFTERSVDPTGTLQVTSRKIGRNDQCPCGSKKKFKNCCIRRGGGAVSPPN